MRTSKAQPMSSTESVHANEPREIRRVLVPCDLSPNSARAVAWACALLTRGGTLQMFHVSVPHVALAPDFGGAVALPPPTDEELAQLAAQVDAELRQLVPARELERGLEVQVEVETAFDAARAIAEAAKRLRSDVICMTTHGRSGLSRALMGSVAENVLRHAHVPVLVITPPAEG